MINVYCNYDLWLTENIHNYWTEKEMKAVNCIPKIVDLSNFSFNSPIYKLLIQGPKEVKLELKKRLESSINNINIVNYGEITNSSSNKGYPVKQISSFNMIRLLVVRNIGLMNTYPRGCF